MRQTQFGLKPYPIVHSRSSLVRFFKFVAETTPRTLTLSHLRRIGLKSANDIELIRLFELLGFLDRSKRPTTRWHRYQIRAQRRPVAREVFEECYADLLHALPEPSDWDDDALCEWFANNTHFSGQSVVREVRTFRALAAEAGLSVALKIGRAHV